MTRRKYNKMMMKAGELIATKKYRFICEAIAFEERSDFYDYPNSKMIQPQMIVDYVEEFQVGVWWCPATMNGAAYLSDRCREARLLGIAMMLTIPEDMML